MKLKELETPEWPEICYLIFKTFKGWVKKRNDKTCFGERSFNNDLVYSFVALHTQLSFQSDNAYEPSDYIQVTYCDGRIHELDRSTYAQLKTAFPKDFALLERARLEIMYPKSDIARIRYYLTRHTFSAIEIHLSTLVHNKICDIHRSLSPPDRASKIIQERFKCTPDQLKTKFFCYISEKTNIYPSIVTIHVKKT
jgi:hypothetical protein